MGNNMSLILGYGYESKQLNISKEDAVYIDNLIESMGTETMISHIRFRSSSVVYVTRGMEPLFIRLGLEQGVPEGTDYNGMTVLVKSLPFLLKDYGFQMMGYREQDRLIEEYIGCSFLDMFDSMWVQSGCGSDEEYTGIFRTKTNKSSISFTGSENGFGLWDELIVGQYVYGINSNKHRHVRYITLLKDPRVIEQTLHCKYKLARETIHKLWGLS